MTEALQVPLVPTRGDLEAVGGSIGYCLNPAESARKVRQQLWVNSLRARCHEDTLKWQNKCGSMLRRIRRIREAVDKATGREVESLSPSVRDNRLQTAIEEYSIQTGLAYEESKSALEHGERGGTLTEPEQRLRQLIIQSTTPPLEEAVSSISDPAFEMDEILADENILYQFRVWILSQSFWLVIVSVYLTYLFHGGSFMSAVPVLLVSVVGLSAFPFPPHGLWKFLLAFTLAVIALKLAYQSPWICDDTSVDIWKVFYVATRTTKQGIPYCPQIYVATRATRLGLFKTTWSHLSELIGPELAMTLALIIHLRSLSLTGRSFADARKLIFGEIKATKDTYTARFFLSLLVTGMLITDWTTISDTKPLFGSSSSRFLGEGISRNYFSPWQVLAIALFVFQIVLDRCMYTLMSHSPGEPSNRRAVVAKRVILITVATQFLILLFYMNMRVVVVFFTLYSLYLSLTARQLAFDIRPVGGKSGFLWGPSQLSYYAYRAYLLIPFLDELRMISDWVASPATSLSLFMWFKVEDCIQNLRFIQAEMDNRHNLPLLKADRACIGVSAIVGLIGIITGPLVFFSGLNVLREPNPVVASLPGSLPSAFSISLLTTDQHRVILYSSTQCEAQSVDPETVKDDEILAPLMAMRSGDLQQVSFPSFSDSDFKPSPPLMNALMQSLEAGNVTISTEWTFDRSLSSFSTSFSRSVQIPAESVHRVLSHGSGNVSVPELIPVAVYLDSTPIGRVIEEKGFRKSTTLEFISSEGHKWWSLKGEEALLCLGERTFGRGPSGGASIGYSISVIGLYIGVVLTVGRFIRLSLQGSSKRIAVEELPETETLMTLCQGIHIARLFKDVNTEKKLYYDLVRLFRDPQLLLAATGSTEAPE